MNQSVAQHNQTTELSGATTRGTRLGVLGEALLAVSAAMVSVLLSRSVNVDPLDRIGQVSGMAALGLHFVLMSLVVLIAVLVAAHVRSGVAFPLMSRLACAAVAGLATGLIAGGLLVALRGTTWPLFASWGDSGTLAMWADSLRAGGSMQAMYPPAAVHLMAWWAELTGSTSAEALRTFQIVGTALFGPIAYLSWRLLLPPVWALGIGLVLALTLIDPYKPYTNVVLVALVPIMIKFLQLLRRSDSVSWIRLALSGTGFGVAAGLLFLTYSAWFVWCAIGVVAAMLLVFPWRTGALRGLVLLGTAGVVFVGVSWPHLMGILRAAGGTTDKYFSGSTFIQPAYIARWVEYTPGELAGVGLFTVLLVIGLGVAVALAARTTVVITLVCCMVSAWLMRFWFASRMYETQSVQLYPRTTPVILYCLLLLAGFSVYFAAQKFGPLVQSARSQLVPATRNYPPATGNYATVGVLCATLLFSLSAGLAVVNHYMPREDDLAGRLAYMSQMVRQQDGQCPAYSRPDRCAENPAELDEWLRQSR